MPAIEVELAHASEAGSRGGHHRLLEGVVALIGAGEQARVGLADMADAEGIDEALERDAAARVDGAEEVGDRELAEPLALDELDRTGAVARLEREDVGRRVDQTVGVERLDLLVAEALDVEGVARGEMLELLDRLCRTDECAGAAADRILAAGLGVDLAHRMAAAGRAGRRKLVGHGVRRPPREVDVDDLRDDVAGPLHGDGVADAEVLAVADRRRHRSQCP